MAYELKVDGMAEISEMLSKLEEAAPAVAAEALYEGADPGRSAGSGDHAADGRKRMGYEAAV